MSTAPPSARTRGPTPEDSSTKRVCTSWSTWRRARASHASTAAQMTSDASGDQIASAGATAATPSAPVAAPSRLPRIAQSSAGAAAAASIAAPRPPIAAHSQRPAAPSRAGPAARAASAPHAKRVAPRPATLACSASCAPSSSPADPSTYLRPPRRLGSNHSMPRRCQTNEPTPEYEKHVKPHAKSENQPTSFQANAVPEVTSKKLRPSQKRPPSAVRAHAQHGSEGFRVSAKRRRGATERAVERELCTARDDCENDDLRGRGVTTGERRR